MTRNPFDEISERLGRLLPEGAQEMRADFERNAKVVVQQTLSRMDLVTREEFDAQADVLARTREQLEAMEARVAELERQAGIEPPTSSNASTADPE
jgi:BMFP domain-containing protein YqiC